MNTGDNQFPESHARQEPVPVLAKRQFTIELSAEVCRMLETLGDEMPVESVILQLVDHAQQGVYRPGAWERYWVIQAFGSSFIDKLEPGCPYGRKEPDGGEIRVFNRPKKS